MIAKVHQQCPSVIEGLAIDENFRSGRFTFRLLQSPFVIRCSSVVLHELLRWARTTTERKIVLGIKSMMLGVNAHGVTVAEGGRDSQLAQVALRV